MSGVLDNLTVLSQWDDDGPPDPRRTLRPRSPETESQDPLRMEAGLAPLEAGLLELGRTLGEGGMGIVRVAEQTTLGRQVAVKTVRAAHDRPEARRRVLQEGLVTGALEHPNIIPVYDLRQDEDGRPLIVLKRVEGEPWSTFVGHNDRLLERFGVTDWAEWHGRVLIQVCNAVAFAHSRGILHRDLKPENVMIGSFGEVYVLDWGLAVALPDCAIERLPRAADARGVAGTPAYMAPEQVRAELPLTRATDVWLLGAILLDIVVGRPPYPADPTLAGDAAVTDVLRRARDGVVELPATLPGPLKALLARAMCPDPGGRHPSVEAFRAELQRTLEGRQVAQLRDAADAQCDHLLASVADPATDVLTVLEQLGAVRFAYRRVLQSWPDHAGVRGRLDGALGAVAAWHLDHGEAQAAELLLAEITTADAALTAKISTARDEERGRIARLAHVEDLAAGVRTRSVAIVMVGSFWILGPLVEGLAGAWPPTWTQLAASCVVLVAIGLAVGTWGRESLMRSVANRQVRYILALAPTLFGFAALGAWGLGLPPGATPTLALLAYASMAAIQLRFGEMAMLPPALTYLATFGASVAWPAANPVWLAVGNLVFVSTLLARSWTHLKEAIREDLDARSDAQKGQPDRR